MEYKEDIRIQKTKRDLRNAIIKLITIDPLEKITVKEICDTAMVNRMTFYKYYEDKYQLLNDTFFEIKNCILSQIPEQQINTKDDASLYCANLGTSIIEVIEDNYDLLVSLKKHGNNTLTTIITNIAEDGIKELLIEINKVRKFRYSITFISSFIFGGFFSTINFWLDHPDKTKGDVLKIINDLRDNIINIDFLFEN